MTIQETHERIKTNYKARLYSHIFYPCKDSKLELTKLRNFILNITELGDEDFQEWHQEVYKNYLENICPAEVAEDYKLEIFSNLQKFARFIGEKSELRENETKDCVVRALSTAYSISYEEAHKVAKEKFDRPDRKGTINTRESLLKLGEYNGRIAEEVGIECPDVNFVDVDSRDSSRWFKYEGKRPIWSYSKKGEICWASYTVGKFIEENPKGVFFILVSGHALCIRDGVIFGNTADAKQLKTRIQRVFEIKVL